MLYDALTLLAAVLLALFVRQYWFTPMRIQGSSMLSTLQNGEMVGVSRVSVRRGDIRRGDVVICHYPGRTSKRFKRLKLNFVKRVIGLPGDEIAMEDGVVYINGEALREDYLDPAHTRFSRSMPPRTLGETEFFVMGDNRDNSNDSRRIGPIDQSEITGRVTFVWWPLSALRAVFSPARQK